MTHKQDMKRVMVLCVLLMVVSVFAIPEQDIQKIQQAMPTQAVVKADLPRTLLVFSLCSGFKHDSIPYWIKALDVMSEKTGAFKVVHSTDMSIFNEDSLKNFDAICFNNTTKLVPDKAQQKAILGFVIKGKGVVGIHAATDSFYEWPKGMKMMGGVFTGHPWTADGTWAIKLDDAEHPLMTSFQGQGFKINDEIYRTSPPLYSRKDRRVLMSLDMSDETTKNAKDVRLDDMDTGISWIKPVGKGRLFYCSLGHNNHLTWNKPVLEHYLAGIQYALGDFKVDDTSLETTTNDSVTHTKNSNGSVRTKAESPVIKKWTEVDEEGKKIEFMTIDGIMVHEKDPAKQPQPKIVTSGTVSCGEQVGCAPSDAVVLFDGTEESLKNWTDVKGKPTKWKLVDGALESVDKAGYVQSKQKFGSCQLHVEWASPSKVIGNGQGRGNSGVFLMGYEVQVLDSFKNATYPDGQAGALYGRSKPLVNASRGPGQWQTYDIIFHRPVFDDQGKVLKKATFTVIHNGVLIQDHVMLSGGTGWRGPHSISEYQAHADALPIQLQDHGNPVRFRNIWVRPLED
ncbi:MAG: ThuA domain-containing protein [Planctomycetota bacterium]|jgi:type 1 glutamine amidotransferase